MPILDQDRNVLVVRIVYDGPPLSGKTTSVRSLANMLGMDVVTPEEQDGRTLFFDWADYVGGHFLGRQIHCQIVSVPGQVELVARRRALLESADSVVFVADTRTSETPRALSQLREVCESCRDKRPPVGIVIQANKRDAPDCLPEPTLREQVSEIAPLAVVDTVATSGAGIREAFVFAVRLALDRVQALVDEGQLQTGTVHPDATERAVVELSQLTQPARATATESQLSEREQFELAQAKASETAPMGGSSSAPEAPFSPNATMPAGFIWPPVDGRGLLHEITKLQLSPERTVTGDWWASEGGWRMHSAASSLFVDQEQGRMALIDWARRHASHAGHVSSNRVIALAPAGELHWRLWQFVRLEQALRERLAVSMASANAEACARDFLGAGAKLLEARRRLATPRGCLPCTLWTIGADDEGPNYVGLMPAPSAKLPEEATGTALLRREIGPLLANLEEERKDFSNLSQHLLRPARYAVPWTDELEEAAHCLKELVRG